MKLPLCTQNTQKKLSYKIWEFIRTYHIYCQFFKIAHKIKSLTLEFDIELKKVDVFQIL